MTETIVRTRSRHAALLQLAAEEYRRGHRRYGHRDWERLARQLDGLAAKLLVDPQPSEHAGVA